MSDFTQKMVNSCDHATVDGYAEALLICIASLKDKEGLLLGMKLGDTIDDSVFFCKQIAERMLKAREK
jgi:hypothetical protein